MNPLVQDWNFSCSRTAVGNWIWTPSSTLVNEFRIGYDSVKPGLYGRRPKYHSRWLGRSVHRYRLWRQRLSTQLGRNGWGRVAVYSNFGFHGRRRRWPGQPQWDPPRFYRPQPVLRFSGQYLVFAGQARLQIRRGNHAHRGRSSTQQTSGAFSIHFSGGQTAGLPGSHPARRLLLRNPLELGICHCRQREPHDEMDALRRVRPG